MGWLAITVGVGVGLVTTVATFGNAGAGTLAAIGVVGLLGGAAAQIGEGKMAAHADHVKKAAEKRAQDQADYIAKAPDRSAAKAAANKVAELEPSDEDGKLLV